MVPVSLNWRHFVVAAALCLWVGAVYGNGISNGLIMTCCGMLLLIGSIKYRHWLFLVFFLGLLFGRYKLYFYAGTSFPDLLIALSIAFCIITWSWIRHPLLPAIIAVNLILLITGRHGLDEFYNYALGSLVFFVFASLIIDSREEKRWAVLSRVVFVAIASIHLLDLVGLDLSMNSKIQKQFPIGSFVGITLHRPNGVSGNIYSAGTILIISYLIYYLLGFKKFDLRQCVILFGVLILASFSQRIYLLPALALPIYFSAYRIGQQKLLVLVALVGIGIVSMNFLEIIPYLDPSNALKVSLAYLTLNSYVENLNWFSLLFGNGLESSYSIAAEYDFEWIVDAFSIKGWDISGLENGYPIHNVYVQLLYENGAILFVAYMYFSLAPLFSGKTEPCMKFLLGSFLLNYAVHNGLYGQVLMTMIFLLWMLSRMNIEPSESRGIADAI